MSIFGRSRPHCLVLTVILLTVVPACRANDSDGHSVALGEGDTVASFSFEAENPATHAFDVEVEMPVGTELEITFLTSDGVTLGIFDILEPLGPDCVEENGEVRCLLHFPILEARTPGSWTANVHKLSSPAARVNVAVVWLPFEGAGSDDTEISSPMTTSQ
jgi:hypothetical protein